MNTIVSLSFFFFFITAVFLECHEKLQLRFMNKKVSLSFVFCYFLVFFSLLNVVRLNSFHRLD
jgi:hypothetical protein